jgi:hypothetical protein
VPPCQGWELSYVNSWQIFCHSFCNDKVTVTLLTVGNDCLTHSHLLSVNSPTVCASCNIQVIVRHILLDCPRYTVRALFFNLNFSLFTSHWPLSPSVTSVWTFDHMWPCMLTNRQVQIAVGAGMPSNSWLLLLLLLCATTYQPSTSHLHLLL